MGFSWRFFLGDLERDDMGYVSPQSPVSAVTRTCHEGALQRRRAEFWSNMLLNSGEVWLKSDCAWTFDMIVSFEILVHSWLLWTKRFSHFTLISRLKKIRQFGENGLAPDYRVRDPGVQYNQRGAPMITKCVLALRALNKLVRTVYCCISFFQVYLPNNTFHTTKFKSRHSL